MNVKKILRGFTLVAVLLAAGGAPTAAQEQEEAEIRDSDLKKPSDFAPREQRVSVRDPGAYRRPDGVLAQAAHEPVMVDVNALHERRLAMYDGASYTEGMTGHASLIPVLLLQVPTSSIVPDESSHVWGWIVAAGVLAICFGSFLIWWRRQMKYAVTPSSQIVRLRNSHRRRGSGGSGVEARLERKGRV